MLSETQYQRDEQPERLLQQKTFPFILYDLLEYTTGTGTMAAAAGARVGGDDDTTASSSLPIFWLPEGTAFIIQNKDVLMRDIMPKFFPQQTKYRSFTRQLNIWGFVRTAPSPCCQSAPFDLAAEAKGDGWRHKDFLRGRPHLLQEIDRVAIKSAEKHKQQQQLRSKKNKANCLLTSYSYNYKNAFAFAPTIHNQVHSNKNFMRNEVEPFLSSTERSRKQVAKSKHFAAAAAAGVTSPAPYLRACQSSLTFQFLSSHMVVNPHDSSIAKSTDTDTERMEMEMEDVSVNGENTEADEGSILSSSTDTTRSRRSDEVSHSSQSQLHDNTDNDNNDINEVEDGVDEDSEFKMKLEKIFEFDQCGDDMSSRAKACKEEDLDLLSILSLDDSKDSHILFVSEEEDNFSSDFDMVYNASRYRFGTSSQF